MSPWQAIIQAAAPDQGALQAACLDPRRQQEELLLRLVRASRSTRFGDAHEFRRIASLEGYREAVAIRDSDAFAPWIERIANGEADVLTADPVVAFEETGGSASGAKLVPYTAASLTAFRAAVLPWLAALAQRRPQVCAGPAYAAISPRLRPAPRLTCGVPVGLASEAAYLGERLHGPLSELLLAPAGALDTDPSRWRTSTLATLVSNPHLAFVAIYSPTFLLGLIDALPGRVDEVASKLDKPDAARLRASIKGDSVDTGQLWPRLDTIATWTDGASSAYAQRLAARFPHAHIEGRGVLATESAITVRIDEQEGCIPGLCSAFIEFVDQDGQPHASHELTQGACYRVVLTTPGGLYRYDIGDEFECVGFHAQAPRLQFLGRTGLASDLVGEKLTDAFVSRALAPLPVPAALVPACTAAPYYELWIDGSQLDGEELASGVDTRLKLNPQYDYARQTGQLDRIRVIESPGLMRYRQARLVRLGMRAGDIKATSLILDRDTLPLPSEPHPS